MKKLVLALGTLALIGIVAMSSTAQIKKGKTRRALTKQIMGGLVRPNCAALGKVAKTAPKDDKEWAALATNAALLNEASYILMADGRCPDGTWAKACTTLRSGSGAALDAIEAKDADATAAAFKTITSSCGACHKAHK